MRRGIIFRFFVLVVLFFIFVVFGLCEGFVGGNGNWDIRCGMVSSDLI